MNDVLELAARLVVPIRGVRVPVTTLGDMEARRMSRLLDAPRTLSAVTVNPGSVEHVCDARRARAGAVAGNCPHEELYDAYQAAARRPRAKCREKGGFSTCI